MSTAIVPKSEMRRNDNIIVGYGEVPAISINGVKGWGLPKGRVTFSEEDAIEYATQLDKAIRQNLRNKEQLLKAST